MDANRKVLAVLTNASRAPCLECLYALIINILNAVSDSGSILFPCPDPASLFPSIPPYMSLDSPDPVLSQKLHDL